MYTLCLPHLASIETDEKKVYINDTQKNIKSAVPKE